MEIDYLVSIPSDLMLRHPWDVVSMQMDNVVNEAFKMIDEDATGRVDKDQFNKCMLEVLGALMLQLEGKPIGVKSSAVIPPEKAGSVATGMPF